MLKSNVRYPSLQVQNAAADSVVYGMTVATGNDDDSWRDRAKGLVDRLVQSARDPWCVTYAEMNRLLADEFLSPGKNNELLKELGAFQVLSALALKWKFASAS